MRFKSGKVKEFFDVQWGDTNKTKASYVPEGYLAYSASGPDGFLDSYDYDREGVVLSAIGANCGVTYFAEGKWSCIKNTIRILPKEGLSDAAYFYYLSKTPNFWPKRGSAQPFISQTDIRELEVQLPTLESQRVIGRVLRQLDGKITANSEISSYLEQIVQTIFQSWFIDFDPVHAKSRGERPDGMDTETLALFPDSFEESDSGLIPAGWSYTKILKFAKVVTGKTPSTSRLELWGSSKMFVTIPDLHHTTVVTRTKRGLSSEGSRFLRKHQIPARSTLVSCIATAGLVGWASDELHTNQQINSATPLRDSHSEWLLFKLKSMAPEIAELASSGSIYPNLNKSTFSEMRILLAHEALLDAFSNSVSPFVGLMTALSEQNELLATLRDAMLPRLISGELEIPEELLVD